MSPSNEPTCGNVHHHRIAIRPVNTPEPGPWVEQAKRCAFKRNALKFSDELIYVTEPVQNFATLARRLKLNPFIIIVESCLEFSVVNRPLAEKEIEIRVGRSF